MDHEYFSCIFPVRLFRNLILFSFRTAKEARVNRVYFEHVADDRAVDIVIGLLLSPFNL